MIKITDSLFPATQKQEWQNAKMDKTDFLIATACGGVAGLIDVLFVGSPLTSKIGGSMDKVADGLVKNVAKLFWKNDKRGVSITGKKAPETLSQCISYLERAFPVNYDARYAKDLLVKQGVLEHMNPSNHHLLSLAHSPDAIGLVCSIISQFYGYAIFVDKGKLIRVIPAKSKDVVPYLQGSDLISMIACGFINWVGHLISDIAGSSSTRVAGKTGRGAGIPMPFYSLFLMCDLGDFDGKTFAETMIQVFQQGYDLRFAGAMAVPVILNEILVRICWTIRQKFFKKKSWRESIPTSQHTDLRMMIIVSTGTLCLIDGVGAAGSAIATGGNVVTFICHLNLVGWARLVMLVLRELAIRYGPYLKTMAENFMRTVVEGFAKTERQLITEFWQRMAYFENQLEQCFREFVQTIEREYFALYAVTDATFDRSLSAQENADASVKLAEMSGVDESKIIHNFDELDDYFS